MGSTVRSPGPVPYSDSEAIAAERQRQQDAQTANNLVQNLLASVDPDHLADQVRHGALGIELFAAIGEAMKHHCAPARDAMVDEMVRLAEAGHIGLGFQKIFECAEAMKVVRCRTDPQSGIGPDCLGYCQPPPSSVSARHYAGRSRARTDDFAASSAEHIP